MGKIISILFVSLLSFVSIQDNQIFIKSNLPGNVYAGDKFTVEITIHKSVLNHYAFLQQSLPNGFKAVEKQSGAANFSFKNGVVKFTWLRIPKSPLLTLSYDIVVDKNMKKGSYKLPTEFVYIYRNLRGSSQLVKNVLNVYNKGDVFHTNPDIPKDPSKIQSLRYTPEYSPERRGLLVQIMISKGNLEGPANLSEDIPQGYNVQVIDIKGADFKIQDDKLKFMWNQLPATSNFIVSYLLSPHKENAPMPSMSGEFSFLNNGQLNVVVTTQQQASKVTKQQHKRKAKTNKVEKEEVINFLGY